MGVHGRPVARCGHRALSPAPDRVEGVFAALADPTRRVLVDRVAADGEQNATELGVGLPMSRQAVAKHLAILEAAGVLQGRRRGREVRYRLRPEATAEASAWLIDVGARWDRRLDALRRHLEADR